MKKLFALALTLCLLLSLGCARADYTLNWDDYADNVEACGIAGSFYRITFVSDLAVRYWVPDVLLQLEVPEALQENNIKCLFQTYNESAELRVQVLTDVFDSLEEVEQRVKQDEMEEFSYASINGNRALIFAYPDTGVINLALHLPDGHTMCFIYSPSTDNGYKNIIKLMIASLQVIEVAQ